MSTMSVWRATAPKKRWPSLERDEAADVVVIGGGLTGTSVAHQLAAAGRSVVLLEAKRIGIGATGNSTGNLYETLASGLAPLAAKWDLETARSVARSRREAIDAMERTIGALGIEANFTRCTHYRYSSTPKLFDGKTAHETIEEELEVSRQLGLQVRLEDEVAPGLPQPRGPAIALDGQAQFHPLAYVRALAERAAADGCRIYEDSAAIDIDAAAGEVRTAGGRVAARELVLATHSPSGVRAVHLGLVANREYGLAFPVEGGAFPPGTYWDRGEERLSTRTLEVDGARYVVCVGRQWPSGQHDAREATDALDALVRRCFGEPEIAFRWSAQSFASPDLLPYVGRARDGAWIATGFATDGLVFGSLAASIIADALLGRDHPWRELYRADRFTPLKSVAGVASEGAKVVKALWKDYLSDRQSTELAELALGHGGIVEIDGERLAAYRSAEGELFALSPVCTHMGCLVHWNEVETTWDCPCHGSRFAVDGTVVDGPALVPLKRKHLRER